MKNQSTLIAFLFACILLFSSCFDDLQEQVDRSTADIGASINKLNANGANIVNVLNGIKDDYPQEIKTIIDEDIKGLVQTTIASTGDEFRCNVDFIRKRIRDGLANTIIKIKNLVRIKKGDKAEPIKYIPPTFCSCVPTTIDLNEAKQDIQIHGYDFANADSIHVFAVKKDGTHLEVKDVIVRTTDNLLVFAYYKVPEISSCDRVELYFKNVNIYSFFVIPKTPIICEEKDFTVTLSPNTYEIMANACGGDDEFAGAVFIKSSGSLDLSDDHKSIICTVHFNADEKDGDTHACFEKSFVVYTAESGKKIKEILQPKTFSYSYENNHEEADKMNGNGFVSHAEFRGDHQGGDVGQWTGASLWFDNIRVTLLEDNNGCIIKDNFINASQGTLKNALIEKSMMPASQLRLIKSIKQ